MDEMHRRSADLIIRGKGLGKSQDAAIYSSADSIAFVSWRLPSVMLMSNPMEPWYILVASPM